MPTWASAVLATAAVFTALTYIWNKVIRPGARAVTMADQLVPLLTELNKQLGGTPNVFEILGEIAEQFRNNAGSTLKDAVDRLEAGQHKNVQAVAGVMNAARDAHAAAEKLKVGVEVARQHAQDDREQLQRAILKLDRLAVQVSHGNATASRIEDAAHGVATDLADSHQRASEVTSTEAGAAADEAARPSSGNAS